MSRTDEIRLEGLDERLTCLERNVGAIMSELNLVAVATEKSHYNYREGCIIHMHMNNSGKTKMINSEILKDEISLDKETEERLLNDIISEAKFLRRNVQLHHK